MKRLTFDHTDLRGWPKYPTRMLKDLGLTQPPESFLVTDEHGTEWLYRYAVKIPANGAWPTKHEYQGSCGAQPVWLIET